MRSHRLLLLCAALLATGCKGRVGQALEPLRNPSGSPGSLDGGADDLPRLECTAPPFDPAPLRLISLEEYNNTVEDLLGDPSRPLAISPGVGATGFDNDASSLSVSPRLAEHYLETAELLADRVVTRLETLVPCPSSASKRNCAQTFIADFGRRIFRRGLRAEETAALLALYDRGEPEGFAAGIWLVTAAILQSPAFLYHVEEGRPDSSPDRLALTDHEIAARLASFLWASAPDDTLLNLAEGGQLGSPEAIEAQARRMLDDPRARRSIRHFYRSWLGLNALSQASKDNSLYPDFDEELRAAFAEETLGFLERMTLVDEGSVPSLFIAPYTVLNERLARFYGSPASVSGAAFAPVKLDPHERPGLLTHASILTLNAKIDRTSPVHRGAFIRQRILCQDLPPPPPNVPELPAPKANATMRERLAQHRADPACSGCHRLMDPIGFGFEAYDAIGRFRQTEAGGTPVDATGEVVASQDADGAFDGAEELSTRLANSVEVRRCFVRQWFRYAFARKETDGDACTLAKLDGALDGAEFRIKPFVIALTQTDAFRYRSIVNPNQTVGSCQ